MRKKAKVACMILLVIAVLTLGFVSVSADVSDVFSALPKTTSLNITKKKPKILFVGNSLTFRNNMPAMFEKLCRKKGIRPKIKEVMDGGQTLYQYAFPQKANQHDVAVSNKLKRLLKTQKWDVVVLQEGIFQAAINPDKVDLAVGELSSLAKSSGAKVVLLMPWPLQTGNKFYNTRPLLGGNAIECFTKEKPVYLETANKYKVALAPVGVAVMRAWYTMPGISLLDSDKRHPDTAGSYLSACVTYATIFGKNPEGNSYYPAKSRGITKAEAKALRSLAADVTVRGRVSNNARVSFSSSTVSLKSGKKQKLKYRITSSSKSTRVASFKSSNPRVASVDKNGKVTAHKAGTAVITVKLNNSNSASCKVTVTGGTKKVQAKKIKFITKKTRISLKKGEKTKLKVSFSPKSTTLQKLKWSSSNPKTATVTNQGNVTARKAGTAVISASTMDGSKLNIKIKIRVV